LFVRLDGGTACELSIEREENESHQTFQSFQSRTLKPLHKKQRLHGTHENPRARFLVCLIVFALGQLIHVSVTMDSAAAAPEEDIEYVVPPPMALVCPICQDVMRDPGLFLKCHRIQVRNSQQSDSTSQLSPTAAVTRSVVCAFTRHTKMTILVHCAERFENRFLFAFGSWTHPP
jgi:hypothetical protein